MGTDFDSDLKRSAEAFKDVVWPVIGPLVSAGDYIDVELRAKEENDGMCKALDLMAGIDGWQVMRCNQLVRGIASRVQWLKPHDKLWNTFTIRASRSTGSKTEYEKRLQIIRRPDLGFLYPGLTVQAYMRGDVLESVAAVETAALYAFIEYGFKGKGLDYWEQTNGDDGNTFYCVLWSRLQDRGVKVQVVQRTDVQAEQKNTANFFA